MYYYFSDTLHSEVVITDANGNVVERTYYAPYGTVLNRPLRDGPGYTGHEEDPATGLVYMQQRYYDPQTGRFLSVDPAGINPSTGENLNRYWYANDNPYRYTDPDGRETGIAFHSEFVMMGAQPQTYQAPGDWVGPALKAAFGLMPFIGAGVNAAEAAQHPTAGNMAGVVLGVVPVGRVLEEGAKAAKDAGAGAAFVERAKNVAKGIPESRLGPSGKPMVHTVEHSTRKAAREAAEREAPAGGSARFDAHPQDGQKPHFQAEDANGNNVKPVVHHCVPNKSC